MSAQDELGLVERLQPKHTADEPIARAVVSTDQAERLRTVEAYLLANNELKRQAAAALTSLIAERDGLRYEHDEMARFVRRRIPEDQNKDQADSFFAWIGMIYQLDTRAEAAEAQLKAAREHIDLFCQINCQDAQAIADAQIAARQEPQP